MTLKSIFVLVGMATALMLAPAAPWAAGTGGSSTTTTTTDYDTGKAAADKGNYETAIASLDKAVAADPTNADAFNMLGFSHRKLGNVEKAFENYNLALAINSKHKGANEYIGELYLELDRLEKAEEHLDRLGRACFFACAEYKELKEEVDEYKLAHGS
jgi:Flp pilus assembly protein TadD